MDKEKIVKSLLKNKDNNLRYTIKKKKTKFKCKCGGVMVERTVVYDKSNKFAWAMNPLVNMIPTYICSKCENIEGYYSLMGRNMISVEPLE